MPPHVHDIERDGKSSPDHQQERDGNRSQDQQDQQDGSQSQDQQDQQDGQRSQQPSDEGEGGSCGPQPPIAVVILGDDYSPPAQMYYFRQEVLSDLVGTRLVATKRTDVDRDATTEFPTARQPVAAPPSAFGRIAVHGQVSTLVEHKKPFALESPILLEPLPNPDPSRFVRSYSFDSLAQAAENSELAGRKAGNPEWSAEIRQYYLKGPTDPRYGKLARQIVDQLPAQLRTDPFVAASAIKLWADTNLIYSKKHRHAHARDPAADVLFGNRIGYCVHFAHIAVYLWRSLGIPARAASGYATPEDERLGSTIVIRTKDSHAWSELYLEGIGWVVLDIHPKRNLDPPVPPLDKDTIRQLGEMARQPPPTPGVPQNNRFGGLDGMMMLLFLLAAVAATLLVLYGVKIWRRLIPRFAGRRAMPRVGYRMALDLLSEVGLSRKYGETRERFASRVADAVPSFRSLTRMHVAARFGDPQVPVDQRKEFTLETWRQGLAALKAEVVQDTSQRRRLLYLLNPLSFFASR